MSEWTSLDYTEGFRMATSNTTAFNLDIDEIIEELKVSKVSERSGRTMDHEQENVFERLRSKGYM